MKRSEYVKTEKHRRNMAKLRAASHSPEARAKAKATRAITMAAKKKEAEKQDLSHHTKAAATLRKTLAAKKNGGVKSPHKKGNHAQIPDATVDAIYGSVLTIIRRVAKSQRLDFEALAARLGRVLSDQE